MSLQPNMTSKLSLEAIKTMYEETAERPYMRALVIGRKGVGKTKCLTTCVKPVLLDLFDPAGEQSLWDDNGNIPPWLFIRRYYDDDGAKRWLSDFEILKRDLAFQGMIGTYVVDSVTQFGDAHLGKILAELPAAKSGDKMDQRAGYGMFLNKMSYYAKTCALFNCHVLWLGHIHRELQADTGNIIYKVMIAGKSDDKLPTLLSESYVMEVGTKSPIPGQEKKFLCKDGLYRWFVVRPNGMYDTSSRLGRMKDDGTPRFDTMEPVDFKALLAKAGLSTDDLSY